MNHRSRPTASSSRPEPTPDGLAYLARRSTRGIPRWRRPWCVHTTRATQRVAQPRASCSQVPRAQRPFGAADRARRPAHQPQVLARTSSHVTLIHRRDTFRASKAAQAAVLNHPKITIMYNSVIKEFQVRGRMLASRERSSRRRLLACTLRWPTCPALRLPTPQGGDVEAGGSLTTVVVASTADANNITSIAADAAFVAIGHIPNTGMVQASDARPAAAPPS
eukprot:scaffold30470_cov27-Tisochrysis_lutea.AAC.2